MLVQRMAKEAAWISLNIDPKANIVEFKATNDLYSSSHTGIIRGVPWAGIPAMAKVCAMNQMMKATGRTRPLQVIDNGIPSKETSAEAYMAAALVDAVNIPENWIEAGWT